MIREFREETGMDCREWTEIGVMHGTNDGGWIVTVFCARSDLSALRSTTDEVVTIIKRSEVQKSDVVINLNWLVPMAWANEFGVEVVAFNLHYPNQL